MTGRNKTVGWICLGLLGTLGLVGCAVGGAPDVAVDASVDAGPADGIAPTDATPDVVDVVVPPDASVDAGQPDVGVDAGVPAVTIVVASSTHACAVKPDGRLFCWGDGYLGEIGDGSISSAPRLSPVLVSGITDVRELAAGQGFTCARHSDGTVSCWGRGDMMGTGVGSANVLHPMTMAGLANIVQISANYVNACALRNDGHLFCWGSQTGQTSDPGYVAAPTEVAGVTDAAQVAVGSGHRCYRSTSGSVACWGVGQGGRLGNGDEMDRATPTPVPGITDAQFIAAGSFGTCVIVTGGAVRCWADGYLNEVAPPTLLFTPGPPIAALPPADRVIVGCYTACARGASDQLLRCWGSAQSGALGNGVNSGSQQQITPTTPTGLGPVTAFASGYMDMVAASGDVTYGWGQAEGASGSGIAGFGVSGDGTDAVRSVPTAVAW